MTSKPWAESMPEEQFQRMHDIIAAPSPVGLEAAMTHGVIKPMLDSFAPDSWKVHEYRGNAGIVLDTHPGRDDMLTVMLIGHADKIRMQVRHVSDDGKIWINSDSFLPTTLIGHEVTLFTQPLDQPGTYKALRGGTVEAIGAIHFADAAVRSGDKGIKPTQLYLELQLHGEDRRKQVEQLGIRAGDPLILSRNIRRGFAPDAFYGAYLDNGLGCFVAEEVARLVAATPLNNVRLLAAMATHEEIGRMGSRVVVGVHKPDVVIALDVSHDFEAAPNIGDRRMTPVAMSKGMTISHGAIASPYLNALIEQAAAAAGVPVQRNVVGRDTGTDAMAAVFAAVDAAATSLGFPIRNMHTISESGHTGDVLAAVYGVYETLKLMDARKLTAEDFKNTHPRLDSADSIDWSPVAE